MRNWCKGVTMFSTGAMTDDRREMSSRAISFVAGKPIERVSALQVGQQLIPVSFGQNGGGGGLRRPLPVG